MGDTMNIDFNPKECFIKEFTEKGIHLKPLKDVGIWQKIVSFITGRRVVGMEGEVYVVSKKSLSKYKENNSGQEKLPNTNRKIISSLVLNVKSTVKETGRKIEQRKLDIQNQTKIVDKLFGDQFEITSENLDKLFDALSMKQEDRYGVIDDLTELVDFKEVLTSNQEKLKEALRPRLRNCVREVVKNSVELKKIYGGEEGLNKVITSMWRN